MLFNFRFLKFYSKKLKNFSSELFYEKTFKEFENNKIRLPIKFLPNKTFLDYHYHKIFDEK